ncbi:MAG: CRISPR-associated endonuclease Cas1 [Candidatus Methanofastidiosia archaeon]
MDRLVIDGFGRFLGIEQGQIAVKEKGRVLERKNPQKLRQIIFSGKGSISSEAIKLLGKHGVDVIFLDFDGKVIARVSPPMLKTVSVRRNQYFAYLDERGVTLSKEFVMAKMKNQIALLGNLAKRRKDRNPEIAEFLQNSRGEIEVVSKNVEDLKGNRIDEVRDTINGMEGNASRIYWSCLIKIFPKSFEFKDRSGRYASDPVNSMLNYGYGILEGEVLRAIHYAGLDPYGGYLHVDRSGRSSLVYDLMEEFRQQIIDKTIVRIVSRGQIKPEDFEIIRGLCRMKDRARKTLLKQVLQKFEDYVRIEEKRIAWCNVILEQARNIVRFLNEEKRYRGFYLRW